MEEEEEQAEEEEEEEEEFDTSSATISSSDEEDVQKKKRKRGISNSDNEDLLFDSNAKSPSPISVSTPTYRSCFRFRSCSSSRSRSRSCSNPRSLFYPNDSNQRGIPDSKHEGTPVSQGDFLRAEKVLDLLRNSKNILELIPAGVKENVVYTICNKENTSKRKEGKKGIFYDDCGTWESTKGTTMRTNFVQEQGSFTFVSYKNGVYVRKKQVNRKIVYVELSPQPTQIIVLNRYYTKLKRDPSYRRRISWLEGNGSSVAIAEYIGSYPSTTSAHGNAKKNPGDDFRRTCPSTMKKVSELSKQSNYPRKIYKKLTMDDSFNGPRDIKQCQNIAYREKRKEKKSEGKKNNFADELLECMEMVDSHPFVQQVHKTKGSLPNFILYTNNQIDDLKYFISHQNDLPLGVDRTFNLGSFFVTALTYKNQRIVRSNDPLQHPIFLGPIYLHRDATFEAYHTFFSAVKSTLCHQQNIKSIEISIPKDLIFGSDEETALTKSMESVFPSSSRTLCTKHLKDNVLAYMKNEAAVPQKERHKIADAVFSDDGVTSADDSTLFDKRTVSVLKLAHNYPKFVSYFTRKVIPTLKNYVFGPKHEHNVQNNWTNNNCESLNNIMKLDADWRPGTTPEMIELLYHMTLLHFKDFRRALYCGGNYRLVQKENKRYGISREEWGVLSEDQRTEKFEMFLKHANKKKRTD